MKRAFPLMLLTLTVSLATAGVITRTFRSETMVPQPCEFILEYETQGGQSEPTSVWQDAYAVRIHEHCTTAPLDVGGWLGSVATGSVLRIRDVSTSEELTSYTVTATATSTSDRTTLFMTHNGGSGTAVDGQNYLIELPGEVPVNLSMFTVD